VEGARLRILIADDHALFRQGVVSLLSAQADFEVVGEAVNGLEALDQARDLRPDLVLMDISMPEMDGLEATRRIKRALPAVGVVILSVSDDDQNLFEGLKAGAQGYLLKTIEPRAFLNTLRQVAQGEAPISRGMATRLIGEFARQAQRADPAPVPDSGLTEREREVLELVAQGKSNKEIAAALSIADNTAKNHLKNILEKLHLDNRVQAATFALRRGLVADRPRPNPA
jgi:two-component system, NarL family, nitrate/nitrite response regulator NarL